MSMFVAITASAVPALVAAFSSATASAIALRTSGGRLVEVSVISLMMLSLNDCMAVLRVSHKLQFVVGPQMRHEMRAYHRVDDKLKFVARRSQKASLSRLPGNYKV